MASASSLVESLFQHSLTDLIKSLRSTPPSAEPAFLSASLASIRRELSSTDPDTKSLALQKLTYLTSLHLLPASSPPPWSHFPAISLLPSPHLPHKRHAHLFLSLFLRPSSTDLLPLSTHQLHKDLTSPSDLVTSLALSSLSSAASPDLSRHLAPDLLPILSPAARPKPRSRATAASLSVLTLSPDSVPLLFPRLLDNLSDPLTVSAAVNVFCELSAADPRSLLPLAPDFHKILSASKNNWVLIKIVKIFSRLAPLEPRLAKRVVDPICDLITRSNAKSLVYECVLALFTSFREFDRAVRVAADKLKDEFLSSEDDPNLRYLGLRGLSVLGEGHPWAVESNREAVVRSLTDPDVNIRHEALNLVMGIVFDSNVVEITLLLVGYALRSDREFANEIIEAILRVCSRNLYEIVEDFDWYVNVLGDVARNPHCEKGEEIERQMVDIGLRVRDARPELVRVARDLLIDPALLGNHFLDRVLSAAAWVCGEYVEFSKNPLELLAALLQPRTSLLSSSVRAVYVQAVLKVIVFYFDSYIEQIGANANADGSDNNNGVESDYGASTSQQQEMSRKPFAHESIVYILNLVEKAVGPLSECHEVEVQERAQNVIGLIHMLKQGRDWGKAEEGLRNDSRIQGIVKLMKGAFSEELGPVSVQAQQKVPVPEGLILKENLTDLATILGKDDIVPTSSTLFSLGRHHSREIKEESKTGTESTSLLSEHRKRHVLYYLAPEKDGAELNDYPKANDPLLSVSQGDAADELLKLTEKSLIPRKAKSSKPRPVVVKLDEGASIQAASKPVLESKDDILSGAIQEVLLGSEGSKPASSQKIASEKSSRRKSKDVAVNSDTISQPKENFGEIEQWSSSSRRSRHHRLGKDRHKNHRENEDKEGTTHKSSQRDSHRYGKHKHRQRADVPLAVVPQAPVIQDFLL